MKPIFKPFGCVLCLVLVMSFAACDVSSNFSINVKKSNIDNNGGISVILTESDLAEVDKIVPAKENLFYGRIHLHRQYRNTIHKELVQATNPFFFTT